MVNLIALLLLVLACSTANAEQYSYTDKEGHKVFSNIHNEGHKAQVGVITPQQVKAEILERRPYLQTDKNLAAVFLQKTKEHISAGAGSGDAMLLAEDEMVQGGIIPVYGNMYFVNRVGMSTFNTHDTVAKPTQTPSSRMDLHVEERRLLALKEQAEERCKNDRQCVNRVRERYQKQLDRFSSDPELYMYNEQRRLSRPKVIVER